MKICRSNDGIVMAELVTASFISVLLMTSIFSFVSFMSRAKYEYQANVELTNKARLVLEQMVWGTRAGFSDRKGISEAVSINPILDSTQLSYTDVTGIIHSIRRNAGGLNVGNIEYRRGAAGAWITLMDPNGAAVFDPAKDLTILNFSQTNPRAVLIRLVIGRRINGRFQNASLSTQVAFRNS